MSSGNSFSDSNVWSAVLLAAVILGSLIIANIIKRNVKFLKASLVPVSVLGGIILLAVSMTVKALTGEYLFNLEMFSAGSSRTGIETLEIVTYHCLAIGFIAMTLRKSGSSGKARTRDVINTGVTTVSTYLVQAAAGLTVTVIAARFVPKLIKASGLLLAFGYGQGTGQALNYGSIYEGYGFEGGKSFGLAVAAMGFLSASIVGIFYLNHKRRKGELTVRKEINELNREKVEDDGEIPMIESIDKITMEIALVAICYAGAYGLMFLLGNVAGDMKSTIYGFNFLFGALMGVILKLFINFLRKHKIMKRDYINNFLLNRISGLAFDIMIVAGIGAIQIDLITDYWFVLAIICVLGAVLTFIYIKFVCDRLFKGYANEQFLAMFGMLTGTASTGIILLREVDPEFETPASENLVYQNFPAIVFGFPIMLLASYAPRSDTAAYICLGAVVAAFAVLNIFLFRSRLFKKKK
jgi:ESS family glutamate:Na+ symporter